MGVQHYGWETVHEGVGHHNPWGNWRIGGFPGNTSLSVGVTSTGNVLATSRQVGDIRMVFWDIRCGWYLQQTLPIGQWSSSNASSGLNNVENNDTYWDWVSDKYR